MFLNTANPINMSHPLNEGLACCVAMLPSTYTRGRARDSFNRNDMAIGAGCEPSMLGPAKRGIRFSASNLTIPSTVHAKMNGVGKISIGLWIAPTSFGSFKAVFDSTNHHTSFFIDTATSLYVGFGGTAGGITGTINFTLNEWQYVLVVYDSFNVNVYRNGQLAGTRTLGNLVFTDPIIFGTNPSGGGSNYAGLQSGWRVWSRALNATQAAKLYRQAKMNFRDMYNWLDPIKVKERDPEVTADAGSFIFTGQDAGLIVGNPLVADSGSFDFTGQDANLHSGYLLDAGTGLFVFTGQDANLLGDYHESTTMYLGRYRRGERLPVMIASSSRPVGCPVVDFWHEGTTKVKTIQIPAHDVARMMFGANLFLGSEFVDGHYVATIRYTLSIGVTVHYRRFEVIGGGPEGNVISVTELRRPLGRAIISHREDGHISMGYNPRIE